MPHVIAWESCRVALLTFQLAPILTLLISSGSKKKKPRHACLSEAKTSYSQRMWAEISSFTPHNGLSSSPSSWRCLLRLSCPVRRPVAALDWVLLKDRNLALAPRQDPEINSRGCLCVLPRPQQKPFLSYLLYCDYLRLRQQINIFFLKFSNGSCLLPIHRTVIGGIMMVPQISCFRSCLQDSRIYSNVMCVDCCKNIYVWLVSCESYL